jgi:hypothetical protein
MYLSCLFARGYGSVAAGLCQAVTFFISSDRHLVIGTVSDMRGRMSGRI